MLYAHLGERLRNEFQGWRAGVFTGNPELGKQMGLRADKKYKLFNGTIPSELLMFTIASEAFVQSRVEQDDRFSQDDKKRVAAEERVQETNRQEQADALSNGAQMLVNRLLKNIKQLEKWSNKNDISCYRLYDADMPEYSAAIDVYCGQTQPGKPEQWYANVQEYAAPKSVDEDRAAQRFAEIELAVPFALNIPAQHISYKQRRRNKGTMQYEKLTELPTGDMFSVQEGAAKLHINMWQYLDTGLFLDHRLVPHTLARSRTIVQVFRVEFGHSKRQ